MAYLALFHWGWLLAAVLVGFAMGWISVVHRGRGLSRRALQWAAALAVVLVILSMFRLLPGRFGYALDLGMMMVVAYLAGCIVGAWLRHLVVSRTPRAG